MHNTAISLLLITFCTFSTVFSGDADKTHKPSLPKGVNGENPQRSKLHKPAIDKPLHTKCFYPTVKVTENTETTGGSGFIVRSTKVGKEWHNVVIGTAHTVHAPGELEDLWVHVPEYENWSTIKNYKKYPMTVYARNPQMDISIAMFISSEKMPVAHLCFDTKLYINTEVFHIGYALLDDARIDYGHVTSPKTRVPEFFKDFIRTNVYTYMGDSGGPLFLKDNYKVIGICRGIRVFRGALLPHISYYRPITDLKTWDGELNNALESVYNEAKVLPTIPFVRLRLKGFVITE